MTTILFYQLEMILMSKMNGKVCNQEYSIGGGLHRHLIKHSLTTAQYGDMFGGELAEYKKQSSEKRRQRSPMCIEYYTSRDIPNPEQAPSNHLAYKNEKVFENKFKNPRTYEYWIANGNTHEETKNILSKSNTHNLAFYQNKYGMVDGLSRSNDIVTRRTENNKADVQIKKIMEHGNLTLSDATEVFKEKHRNGPRNVKYWTSKGYDTKSAKIEVTKTARTLSPRCKEYWIKYHEMDQRSAGEAVVKWQKQGLVNSVSKTSIQFFSTLIESANINEFDASFGTRGDEYSIYDEENKNMYYYDFKYKNIIIEYNGSAWHPNIELLDTNCKQQRWKKPRSNKSFYEIYSRDLRKKELAIGLGYEYIIVWYTDEIDAACKRITKIINEKIKE